MSCGCNLRKRITKNRILLDKRDVYLDYNATTKPCSEVLAKVDQFNRNFWGNPSAQNSRGVNLFNLLEKEIISTKKVLGCDNFNIYFDCSSSSLIKRIEDILRNREIISTTIEHKSLLESSKVKIGVDDSGQIDLKSLGQLLKYKKNNPVLIYSPVNHETGIIQPFIKVYELANKYKVKVIFDAVQTISRINFKSWLPYCDGFYYSGHKIYGLQGAAALLLKDDNIDFKLEDTPLPFSLFTGTFNTPSVIALLEATNLLINDFNNGINELKILHTEALFIISKLEYQYYIESSEYGVPGIINISFPELEKIEDLLFHLNKENIQLSRLSACTGDINRESYVLEEMGRDIKRCKTSLRISFGKYSKRDDFFKLTSSIKKFLASIKY
ncbi:MAG: aminotransferase class V-fold PLP-dependent enzyme [Spirochaetaceae bacterium]